jgi:hypothetical protein
LWRFASRVETGIGFGMENTASPLDLFTRLEIALQERNDAAEAFDVFKQDAIMAHAPADGDVSAPSSDEAADAAAGEVDTFSAEVRGLLRDASDADLTDAYARSGGDVGHPVAEALLGEIKRRNSGN